MSNRTLSTILIAITALILLVVAVFVKTGVFKVGGNDGETESDTESTEEETETSIVLMSEINEDGDIDYYTMITSYRRPSVNQNFTYQYTLPKSTAPDDDSLYTELTSMKYVYDEQGNNVLDENGEPVTQIVSYTELITTTEPETTTEYVEETEIVYKTNVLGKKTGETKVNVLNPTGETEPVTEKRTILPKVTIQRPTKPVTTLPYSANGNTESAIVSSINATREANGLPALTVNGNDRTVARGISTQKAFPDSPAFTSDGITYSIVNINGTDVAAVVQSGSIGAAAAGENYTSIGVGVIEYNGKVYTTIILR